MDSRFDPGAHVRPLAEQAALAERAADYLRTPLTRLPLNPQEAAQVVAQMGLISFAAGAAVLREGEDEALGSEYMLLLLDGEVQIDSRAGSPGEALALAVLGPGNIVGEMALLDGAPRSASCTAVGPVLAAALSRRGLERLIDEHPRAAVKLMMGLAQRLGDRLRALGQQVQIYAQLAPAPAPPRR